MPLALILSSFVAAGRIGGAAQQYVLAAHKIDPVLVPTVMLGRSPAKGAQGQVTSPALFARILAAIEAGAVADHLVPLGDWITPNLWELGWLTGGEIRDTDHALSALRSLGKPGLITSAPAGEAEIGLIYADGDEATLFAHPRHPQAPNG